MALKEEDKEYLKDKFELDHLSDLELDFLISEVERLSRAKKKNKPVTDELREEVIQLAINGMTRKQIAKQVDYSLSTIDNILKGLSLNG